MTSIDSGLPKTDFETIFSEAEPKIAKLLQRGGVPPEDAEDLVHDCLVRFLPVQHELRDPVAWLLAAVHYAILMYWRSARARRDEQLGTRLEAVLAAQTASDAAARVDLMRALQKLAPDLQEVLHLRYWQGLEPIDIARHKGCSTRYVRRRSALALEMLRTHILL